jgi:hypothetical protein
LTELRALEEFFSVNEHVQGNLMCSPGRN